MKRFATAWLLAAFLLPSPAFADTCRDRGETCSLGELFEINANAQTLKLSPDEHTAILLEILTHLRRIIVAFAATSQPSNCVQLAYDLRPGSTDANTEDEVSALQFFLRRVGLFSGIPTGYYGPVTAHAVYTWQKRNGIDGATESTGVGAATREKIRRATCPDSEV